jgi:hypothetical protein
MRQSGANGRGLTTGTKGHPTRRVSTGRTRIVLLAVIGLLLTALSPLVINGRSSLAATLTPTTTVR